MRRGDTFGGGAVTGLAVAVEDHRAEAILDLADPAPQPGTTGGTAALGECSRAKTASTRVRLTESEINR